MAATRARRQAGVSLIEAMVALAVMAFGVLGVVGVQATLRANADNSRQRAEAVRIAQQGIENWRGFTVIPSTAGQVAYNDIAQGLQQTYSNSSYNTAYSLSLAASAAAVGRAQNVAATVSWTDRSNTAQSLTLSSTITGIPPELAGSLIIAGNAAPAQLAMGRNAVIPAAAVDQGNGTSTFSPPGGSGLSWVFSNFTGLITSICNPNCNPSNSFFLGGYINFSTGPSPSASSPSSAAVQVGVVVNVTSPAASQVTCFQQLISVTSTSGYEVYYCAIPVPTPTPPTVASWSGQSDLVFYPSSLLSTSMSDVTEGNYKVCRYTPVQSDSPPNGNVDHPLNYANVSGALVNQNFLVVGAPYVTSVTGCPTDGTTTYRHQPLS
jgi:Tfp pilus assembly protein PilV